MWEIHENYMSGFIKIPENMYINLYAVGFVTGSEILGHSATQLLG